MEVFGKSKQSRKRFDDVILKATCFGCYQIVFISVIGITMAMTGFHIMATDFKFDAPIIGSALRFSVIDNRKKNERRKHFDDVILEAGGFGRYQIIFMVIFGISRMMAGSHVMTMVFLFATPNFRCASPDTHNDTYDYPINTSYNNASLSPHDRSVYSTCRYHDNHADWATVNGSESSVRPRDTKEDRCTAWVYDTYDYTSTAVSEFNLVCGRKVLGSHAKMLFFAGYLAGSGIFGPVSDEFGRRTVVTLCVTLVASSGLGISFAPTLGVFVAMLFINGMASVALLTIGFVMVVELTTPDTRVRPSILYFLCETFGSMCSIPLAYWLRSWRNLQLATSAPCFAFLVLFAWWLPESGRWLLSKGRLEQAEKEVFRMARYNGVTLPSGFNLHNVVLDKKERGDWRSVIKSRTLCRNIAIICFNSFSLGMSLFGIMLSSVHLSGNRFINTFAMLAVELPAQAILSFLLDTVGRKRVYFTVTMLAGTVIIGSIIPVFLGSLQAMTTALLILGRVFLSQTFLVIGIMTMEMFPTYVRGIVMGFAAMTARAGAMVAPYVNDLGVTIEETYGQTFPSTVFAILTIVSGFLALFLPSTDKVHLPETVQVGVTLGQHERGDDNVEQAERRCILTPDSRYEETTL